MILPAAILSGSSWMRKAGHGMTLVPQCLTSISNQSDVLLRLPQDAVHVPSGTKPFKRLLLHTGVSPPAHRHRAHPSPSLTCFSVKLWYCHPASSISAYCWHHGQGKAKPPNSIHWFYASYMVYFHQHNECYLWSATP